MGIRLSKRFALFVLLAVLMMLLVACDGNGTTEPSIKPTETVTPPEDVEIIIGNLTDLTGVSAAAQEVINYSLDDLVNYFNEENLIPGVELKVKSYDTQFDPTYDIPGYEWLKQQGADLIVSGVTSAPVTLRPRVNQDGMLLFTLSGNLSTVEPPGYVFAAASLPEHEALTLLKWISENDWDYQTNGPARIGGTSWDEPNAKSFLTYAQDYAKAFPKQFEWGGAYYTDFTFMWTTQVDALKDCDYVLTPNPMTTFVKQFRDAGYDAKFIGNGPHFAMLQMVDDAGLWEEIEGMLFITPSRWWGEKGELVELREQLLYENHPDKAEQIKRMGGAYNALDNFYVVLDIVRNASENVGPENIDLDALYESAQSYSLVADGVERYSFTETKRGACNVYGVYEASAEKKELVRANTGWLPAVRDVDDLK